jgi:hypothetical protein
VALFPRSAAVCTSKRQLRWLSHSGLQRGIMSLLGPVVTCVANGDRLAVFYHGQHARAGEQNLRVSVFSFRDELPVGCVLLHDTAVALSADGALLTWAGISETKVRVAENSSIPIVWKLTLASMVLRACSFGFFFVYIYHELCLNHFRLPHHKTQVLYTLDSTYQLRALHPSMGYIWTPCLDITAAKAQPRHMWWPLDVNQNKLVYALLNNSESHPAITPRPLVLQEKMHLALLLKANNMYAAGEEEFILAACEVAAREAVLSEDETLGAADDSEGAVSAERADIQASRLAMDKMLIKLIHHCCKPTQQRYMKALEYGLMLHSANSVELAVQVATQLGAGQLASRLLVLAQMKAAEEVGGAMIGAASASSPRAATTPSVSMAYTPVGARARPGPPSTTSTVPKSTTVAPPTVSIARRPASSNSTPAAAASTVTTTTTMAAAGTEEGVTDVEFNDLPDSPTLPTATSTSSKPSRFRSVLDDTPATTTTARTPAPMVWALDDCIGNNPSCCPFFLYRVS